MFLTPKKNRAEIRFVSLVARPAGRHTGLLRIATNAIDAAEKKQNDNLNTTLPEEVHASLKIYLFDHVILTEILSKTGRASLDNRMRPCTPILA